MRVRSLATCETCLRSAAQLIPAGTPFAQLGSLKELVGALRIARQPAMQEDTEACNELIVKKLELLGPETCCRCASIRHAEVYEGLQLPEG